jgi:chlorophyllide a reductase subunit Y
VQKAKELGIPALYFTNLISARPLMGPAGAGSLAQVVNAAMANKTASTDDAFFEGVGTGDTAGVWEGCPEPKAAKKARSARSQVRMTLAAKASRRKKSSVGGRAEGT